LIVNDLAGSIIGNRAATCGCFLGEIFNHREHIRRRGYGATRRAQSTDRSGKTESTAKYGNTRIRKLSGEQIQTCMTLARLHVEKQFSSATDFRDDSNFRLHRISNL
jgi:hypothetical protein